MKKVMMMLLSLMTVFSMNLSLVFAEGTTSRNLSQESTEFLNELTKEGYAEVGKYKVEKITNGVYHMDEGIKSLPGGATDENGNMNNPSSIYFVDEGDHVLIVDGGNPIWNNQTLSEDAQIIVEAMCSGKDVDVVFTHGHYDHLGLLWSETIINSNSNIHLNKIYIEERDNIDNQYNVLYAKTALGKYGDKVQPIKAGDSFTSGNYTYETKSLKGHTNGSIAIINKEKNVIFTGDGIGSGFVWLVWDNIDNCLADYKKEVIELKEVVKSMGNPHILAGHRWQQFWDGNELSPGELDEQYLDGMLTILDALCEGTAKTEPYALRNPATDLKVTYGDLKAEIDTTQKNIDEFVKTETDSLKDELNSLINETVEEKQYTPNSYSTYQTALENAKNVLQQEDVQYKDLKAAKQTLEDAKNQLVKKADKTQLKDLYDQVSKIEKGNYTKDSYQALQNALKTAKDVLANENVTQEEVDQSYTTLESAKNGLKEEKITATNPSNTKKTNSVKTGDNTSIAGVMMSSLLALGMFVFLKKVRV